MFRPLNMPMTCSIRYIQTPIRIAAKTIRDNRTPLSISFRNDTLEKLLQEYHRPFRDIVLITREALICPEEW